MELLCSWACPLLIISEEAQGDSCRHMKSIFQNTLAELFRKKLGLEQEQSEDAALIQGLLDIMESEKLDYTNTFRNLTQALTEQNNSRARFRCCKKLGLSLSRKTYQRRFILDKKVILMNQVNPKFILRNYMAQEAIDAAENHDFQIRNFN